jgi:acyl dehydratase
LGFCLFRWRNCVLEVQHHNIRVAGQGTLRLGWKEITLTAPVFPGDTIYARSEVLAVRPSKSRPTQGIVTTRTEGFKADGTVFMAFERSSLIPTRAAAIA